MQRLTAVWNHGWIGKAVISLVGLLIICCILGIFVQPRTRSAATEATNPPVAQQAAAAAPDATQVAVATDRPQPTDPPKPTKTPAPTDTPEPTATPSPVPSPTPLPQPITIKGNGKTVTDPIVPPTSVNRVVFTHAGKRNFIVKVYTKDGNEDYLVNAIGRYEGSRPLIGTQEVYFEIDADGPWTATIEPLSQKDELGAGMDGTGDVVSDLFWPAKKGPVPFSFAHDGKRNFIVQLHCAGGDDYVANEIGAVKGEVVVRFVEGPCLWEVEADGGWSVTPK